MGDVGLMGMRVPGASWRDTREAAMLAEQLGYSCLTMGESWGEDALTSLAQLAAVTSRLRVGTSIVPRFARSPANLRIAPYRADLPIYVAALSPQSLRLTGELADGWLPIFLAPSRMTAATAELEAGARAAGRSLADIRISPQVSIYVTDDVGAARDRERPHIAFYIGGMGVFYHQYMHRIGFGADADRVRASFQSKDRDGAAKLVTDEMVDAVTILGTPQQCRDQMQRFFDAGAQEVRLVFNEPNKDSYLEALRAVAPR